MFPRKINAILNAKIPKELIKTVQDKDYISGSTVIGYLNAAFDNDWDFITTDEWIENSIDKVIKPKNGVGQEVVIAQPPVAHVKGHLIVRYYDENNNYRSIEKTGYGSKILIGGATEQESVFKSAATDAMKKAATHLGLGLELYRNENEKKFFADFGNKQWSSAEKEACKTQLDFMERFKKSFADAGQDGDKVIEQYVLSYTNGVSKSFSTITPDTIDDFIASIKKINPNFN